MLLTIDAGNTNVVFGLFDQTIGEVSKAFRIINDPTRTADEYIVWLRSLLEINGLKNQEITGAVIGSVVPESSFNLISLCRRYLNCEPVIVGDSQTKLGLNILMPNPKEVGADRLMNALAGYRIYKCPLIIIDFGTATTFDLVNETGDYCGGIIAPGINLSLRALHMAAAKLPLVEIAPTHKIIGNTTVSAMQSGIYWGYVSMIEGMVERVANEFSKDHKIDKEKIKVIATGGLAELFASKTSAIDETDRALTLKGLAEIYQLNWSN